MDFESHDLESTPPKPGKRAYSVPTLVEFGAIQQISLGGAGSVAEAAMMTAGMKHP